VLGAEGLLGDRDPFAVSGDGLDVEPLLAECLCQPPDHRGDPGMVRSQRVAARRQCVLEHRNRSREVAAIDQNTA
jgi:hypothetical protein